jgi:hypothetical protein
MAPAEQSAWNLALFLWKQGFVVFFLRAKNRGSLLLLRKRERRLQLHQLVTAFEIRTHSNSTNLVRETQLEDG